MLRDLEQTLAFYRTLERRPGGFPGKLLVPRDEELTSSPPDLGLPETYLSFARKYHLEGVTVGTLSLTPFPNKSIFEALALANGDRQNPLVGDKFIHVASYEADLILVVKDHDMHSNGKVYYLDISTGLFPPPVCLANDFEDFVVVAGNIYQRALDEQIAASQPFMDVLNSIVPYLDSDGKTCWEEISESYS